MHSVSAWFTGPSAIQSVRTASPKSGEVAQTPASPSVARDSYQAGGTYVVRKADTLWGISEKVFGDATRWRELHALNKDKVFDPNLIFPGTALKLPGSKTPVVEVQRPAAEPKYPTVGEYYQQRFDHAVDATISSVHGAAEMALPPFLLGEMAGIKMRHHKAALDRIMELPRDAKGKWRIEARRISDEESAKASAEIRALPGVRAISAVGGAVVDGVAATGQAIADGAVWVGTQAVEVPKAAARGVFFGIGSLGEALSRFSKWALGE